MSTTKLAQRNQRAAEAPAEDQGQAPRTATVHLPFVTAEFRAPDIHLPPLPVRMPGRSDVTDAVSAIRSRLPSPKQTAYYAGLGLLGVLEIIEWPVALAIGVGTAIAQSCGSQPGADRSHRDESADR